ncbi:unnamed protein product [Brachionus calyciflorus]|uniref:Uncharacterized protein n=1 Tax=Brachionus calyciflorus TaxID=104777 RepID=A0A813M4B3_9BILA|nr:unnamed protein product [Brachionus calyciflorus]
MIRFLKRLKSTNDQTKIHLVLYLFFYLNSIVTTQSLKDFSNDPNSIKNFILDSNIDDVQDLYNLDSDNIETNYTNNQEIDSSYYRHDSNCYDSVTGAAKKCMPEFVNAAFGLKISASNTCGQKVPSEYCVQTNLHNSFYSRNNNNEANTNENNLDFLQRFNSRCRKCDFYDKRYSHPPEYLNDYNNQGNVTWWQSDTMLEGIQYPNSVNLTLNLGKTFDINYVQIKFNSPRPESFAIYKRTNESSDWTPYQFYSASCKETYGISSNQIIRPGNEAKALCTDEFSDIAPLTGASVVFGTLEDRPSAYNFEDTPELIEWVTATDIRITLNRLNTFGDEVFNDPQVLKSYYYAISDIAVGGRCKCNGHASKCVYEQQHDFEDRLKCKCEHNTAGVDCGECLPFYNDVPWAPATQLNAHECKPCSCNGLSKKCHFNQTLYESTGHGGYCDDCEGNTQGPHCEECKLGFYRRENENRCIDCQCNHIGSESPQCDPNGKCKCKPGVVGDKCDRCAPYHYELSTAGCKQCQCNLVGSFDTPPICDPRDGSCRCKANIEGQNCDIPKPGFFYLSPENTYGAIPCFCYGHSSTCNSSQNYYSTIIESNFELSKNFIVDSKNKKFEPILENSELSYSILSSTEDLWYLAPREYLGNLLNSYNQNFSFELRIEIDQNFLIQSRASRKDLIIENSQYNMEIYIPIYGSGLNNKLPNQQKQNFSFKLNQHSGWMPQLTSKDFHKLLSNVSAIKIRASYVPNSKAILSKISLATAKKYYDNSNRENTPALFVEECKCPIGHVGERCENCAPGYRRDPINGGVFAKCVPCNCNNHSISCDPNTGKCDCRHHTSGDNCEKCEEGYFGNPIFNGKIEDLDFISFEKELSNLCKKCPCPNDGPCAEIFNFQLQTAEIVCLDCPEGTQGNLCELCDDGYFNFGSGTYGQCEKCLCNGNIDENAIGNCDDTNGKCLKCIYNTTGDNCEKCLPNYWGNALNSLKCHSCDCFEKGSITDENGLVKQCNLSDGHCECKPNVKNRKCDECKEGYWNILSGNGCEECKCNPLGSFNLSCDTQTGQCFCRPGVQGKKCDQCMPLHYGFSDEGCKTCDCDPFGSELWNLQCDEFGKCSCRESFDGLKCNKCAENRFNFTSGCQKCDDCYNLVQYQVNILRIRINSIEESLKILELNGPEINSDQNLILQETLEKLRKAIDRLHSSLFKNLRPSYKDSVNYLQSEVKRISEAIKSTDQLFDEFNFSFKKAEKVYNQTSSLVFQAQSQLNFIQIRSDEQIEKIELIKKNRIDNDLNERLQQMAKQTREAADLQMEQAKELREDVSTNILEAQKALREIQNTLVKYEYLEQDKRLDNFEDLSSLKIAAKNLIKEAEEQKNILDQDIIEANKIILRIKNFKIPNENNFESDNIESINFVNDINLKANSLKKEIENLRAKFEQFSNIDSLSIVGNAQTQLNKAHVKQKDIDFLYDFAERVRQQADSAQNITKELFSNASKILETLGKFDQLILSGKENLEKAESLQNETENNIKMSNELYVTLNTKLNNLIEKLDQVKKTSLETESKIRHANQTLNGLDIKLGELTKLSSELFERVKNMDTKFNEFTKNKSQASLEIQSNLIKRNDLVLKQAESVTNGTQKLLDNTNNALESLQKINKSLSESSVSSNLKREDIERLKTKFQMISAMLDEETQLDESIQNLERNTKYLLQTAREYQFRLDELSSQVKNLEDINNSLERKCYANTFAKPEL